MKVTHQDEIKPIFIFSLPRSGSTLLQRMLSAHHSISTTSEPWLLLPFFTCLNETNALSIYRYRTMARALNDFCRLLPSGHITYHEEIANFALRLYRKAAKNNALYFLDKTPRYHMIVDDIIKAFPTGKFIFLWRNPLSIIASMIETFGRGRWRLYDFKVDLFDGINNLIVASQKYASQVISLNFEDIVRQPHECIEKVFRYLTLPIGESTCCIESFMKVQLHGKMGDPSGIVDYDQLSQEPLDKWRLILKNPVRKNWSRRYLKWLGPENLAVIGYDHQRLLHDLETLPISTQSLLNDMARILFGTLNSYIEIKILKEKREKLFDLKKLYSYS